MRVLVSGSTGLVGGILSDRLKTNDYTVVPLKRARGNADGESMWEPIRADNWSRSVGAVDAVVHLAGEPVAARRWSTAQKKRIYDSRVIGTRQLCEQLSLEDIQPKVLVCASAIGYYGDRGDEILTEDSMPGDGFLPEVCRDWETACEPAREAGIRVVNLRIGVVLSEQGGALPKMLPIFRLGLGGKLGNGRQYMSWISLDDLVAIIMHSLSDESLSGPVNAVGPEPVTNAEFTKALARQIKRPAFFPVPAAILHLVAGEMADAMPLASTRVLPKRLTDSGFSFSHPTLETALAAL